MQHLRKKRDSGWENRVYQKRLMGMKAAKASSPLLFILCIQLLLEAVINPHAYQLDHKTLPEGRVEQCVMWKPLHCSILTNNHLNNIFLPGRMALDNKSHDLSSIFRTHMTERSDSYYLLSDLHKCTHQTHKLFLKLILIKSHLPPNKTFCSHCVSLCVVCGVHLRLCLCVNMQRPEQLCFILWDRVSHLTRGSVSVRLVGQ